MTKQAGRSAGRARLVAAATLTACTMALPLGGTAAAAVRDQHASMQTQIIVKATTGHLVQAHRDVIAAGGRVVSGRPVANGFYAQLSVMAVVSLRHAPGIASVVITGRPIVN
jgi:hypothetical protein